MPYQFSYYNQGVNQFSGNLVTEECTHVNPTTHQRCRRRVTIGLPLCWQHLQKDDHLKIKPSTIAGAGVGLFAYDGNKNDHNTILFRRGNKVANYYGEIITENQLISRYGNKNAPYAIELNPNRFEDGALKRGVGTLPNHKVRRLANADLKKGRNNLANVTAIKNIKNNEEIFVDYGDEYIMHEPGVRFQTKYKRN